MRCTISSGATNHWELAAWELAACASCRCCLRAESRLFKAPWIPKVWDYGPVDKPCQACD